METPETVIDRMINLGYLKYVLPSEAGRIRRDLNVALDEGYLMSRWSDDLPCSEDRRTYNADSEWLMEGGVGDTILDMRSVLEAEGVRVDSVEDHMSDDVENYYIAIGGERHQIFDERQFRDALLRGVSTKRLLEIVNGLLGVSGSAERLYWINGGDEGRVILLTEQMYQLLSTPGLGMNPDEMPRPSDAIGDDGSTLWYWTKGTAGSLKRWDSDRGLWD